MISLVIQLEDELVKTLRQVAERKATTVEVVANEALKNYLRTQSIQRRSYSFIGIGRSGKNNLSKQAEAILEKAANRREGWSLRE